MTRSATRSRILLLLLFLGVSTAVVALGRYTVRAAAPSPELPPGDQRVFLAYLPRGGGAPFQPTLGPSATSTRTPLVTLGPSPTTTPMSTAGPTLTPGPTSTPAFALQQAVMPEQGNIGTHYVFTLGLLNSLPVPVHVTLVNALPEGLTLERIWPPSGTVILVAGNTFTATLTVAHNWSDNLFFSATGDVPPCSLSCYVVNTTTWAATWSGGGNSGTSHSRPILLSNTTPTPTWTPPVFPTWPPSPTPTAGPSPTRPPTLGPSPTATPGR